MREKPRVVLDTNLFVSALISPGSTLHRLLLLWRQGKIILLTSADLIGEVDRVLHRRSIKETYQLTDEQIQRLLTRLEHSSERITPLQDLPLHSRDPKDDKLLALALGGNADYLITGENDLLVLDGHSELRNLRIITAAAFLQHEL